MESVRETKGKRGILMFTTIELFAGAGGLALGVERAGFETLGLIEFDKDAADTLKKNRPDWNVIHDDIANVSCLDLEEYFHIRKGFFIIMHCFSRSCNPRCFCLKMLGGCLRTTMEIHIKQYYVFLSKPVMC